MGTFSDYDLTLQEVSHCMADQPSIEERVDRLTTELDELCKLAADQDTSSEFDRNSVGHLVTRSNRLLTLLLANRPVNRVVYLGNVVR